MLELNQSNTDEILIKDVNEDTFMDDVIEASKTSPIVVDFWAPWCGPCKALSPILEQISNEREIVIAKVNTDSDSGNAAKYGVRGIPAMFLFKDGKMIVMSNGRTRCGGFCSQKGCTGKISKIVS